MSLKQTEPQGGSSSSLGTGRDHPRRGRAAAIACPGITSLAAAVIVGLTRSSDTDVATANEVVSPNVPPSFAFHRPSIATDPVRPGHMAVASMEGTRLETCYLALSGDGGRTWMDLALVGAGGRPLPTGATKCWNPSVAYGPSDDGVVAAWTDTRRDCSASEHQDVYFTRRSIGDDPQAQTAKPTDSVLC